MQRPHGVLEYRRRVILIGSISGGEFILIGSISGGEFILIGSISGGEFILIDSISGGEFILIDSISGGEFILIGGSNKELGLYTKEGIFLTKVMDLGSWVWSVDVIANQNFIVCGEKLCLVTLELYLTILIIILF